MTTCKAGHYKDNSIITHGPLVCFGGYGQPGAGTCRSSAGVRGAHIRPYQKIYTPVPAILLALSLPNQAHQRSIFRRFSDRKTGDQRTCICTLPIGRKRNIWTAERVRSWIFEKGKSTDDRQNLLTGPVLSMSRVGSNPTLSAIFW
jgi:hypothetical protein